MLILLEWAVRHRPLLLSGMVAAAILSGSPGCASPTVNAPGQSTTTATGDGDGDGDSSAHASIMFAETSNLTLSPLGVAEIVVNVDPALGQTVTFEILADATHFDGFLVGNTAFVDEYGNATIALHAPSQTSTFSVRAALSSGEEARRLIEVSDQGFGSLKVRAEYNGTRKIDTWHASVWPGMGCNDLDNLFLDGFLISRGSEELEVKQVPAGTLLAVTVRGDEIVGGCLTVSNLSTDQELEIAVAIADRPIDPKSGKLDLSISSSTDGFARIFESSISQSAQAFLQDYAGDGTALLEMIKAELPKANVADFEDAVLNHGLEKIAESSLSTPTAVSDQIRAILVGAAADLVGDDILLGELKLNGLKSEFSLSSAHGIKSELAGFTVPDFWQVEIETGDTVALGGEITYNAVKWLTALAEAQAQEDERDDPVTLIQQSLNCKAVSANLIVANGSDTLAGCDEACLVSTCTELGSSIWEQVKSSGMDAVLVIGASGSATVHGKATIATLDGTWVGKTSGTTTSLKGTLTGQHK